MRSLLGAFGLVCGAIVVWTVGNYGYGSSDDPNVKWNMAFLFGAIACGGLFGHAVSARLWRTSKTLSLVIGGVCGIALIVNLSNSLGALAGQSRQEHDRACCAQQAGQIGREPSSLACNGNVMPCLPSSRPMRQPSQPQNALRTRHPTTAEPNAAMVIRNNVGPTAGNAKSTRRMRQTSWSLLHPPRSPRSARASSMAAWPRYANGLRQLGRS